MGQIVKQMSAHTTRYYWYPGDRKEWVRGLVALVLGGAAYCLAHLAHQTTLVAAAAGTAVTAALAGYNFGRRDSRELARFAEIAEKAGRAGRRQAVVHTGRAAWRGVATGAGGAAAAVVIANLSTRGLLADWLLPMVPAVVGALFHQIGMMYERLGRSATTAGPAAVQPARRPKLAPTTRTAPVRSPVAAVPAAFYLDESVSVPEAMLTPVKSVKPPMPASLALLELAEAHRAEIRQTHRDTPAPTVDPAAPVDPKPERARGRHAHGRHVGRARVEQAIS